MASRKPVVSTFFTPLSSSSSPQKPPVKKHASVISLSDDDSDGDSDIQIVEHTGPGSKGKALPLKRNRQESPSLPPKKQIKVAPLFNRTKTSATQNGQQDTSKAVSKLQVWKHNDATANEGSNEDEGVGPPPSSSQLPEAPVKLVKNAALEAQRAKVRQRLLGSRRQSRRSDEDTNIVSEANSEDALDKSSESDEDVNAIASTSASGIASKALARKSKAKGRGKAKESSPADSRFAKFAAAASEEDSEAGSKYTFKGKGKGRATVVDPNAPKYTPLELQVLALKEEYPDTLLIIEVGYKFKFFGDDARIASKELNIACFMSQNFWTAMIPVHRLQVHIKRLIASGYKVGVVRQKETAALKKAGDNRAAPFTRELTNLYTAATYVEGLDDDAVTAAPPTYGTLLSIHEQSLGGKGTDERVVFGLVAAQPSTGEVIYDEFEDGFLRNELETRLLHIQPGEIVIQGGMSAPTRRVLTYLMNQDASSAGLGPGRLEELEAMSASSAATAITSFFEHSCSGPSAAVAKKYRPSPSSLDMKDAVIDLSSDASQEDKHPQSHHSDCGRAIAAALDLPDRVIVALAGLMVYLGQYDLESIFQRPNLFTPFSQRGHMLLNANTLANLEIFRNQTDFSSTGSLFSILDHTKTAFGQRMLRRWVAHPLLNLEMLKERVDAVDELVKSSSYLLGKMRGLLKGLPDLERGLARIHYRKSSPQELVRVIMAFQRIANEFPDLPANFASSAVGFKSPMIAQIFYALPQLKKYVANIIGVLNLQNAREGLKADLWNESFEPAEITDLKDVLLTVEAEFANHLRECRKVLKKPNAEYITVAQDEYLLEIVSPSNENWQTRLKVFLQRITDSKVVPNDWIRINGTKSVYRYRSPKMMQLLEERAQAQERLDAEANSAFEFLLGLVAMHYENYRDVVVKLSTMDCLLSLATVALSPGYVKPILVDTAHLDIQGGRHPIVEQLMEKPFIPNNATFHKDGLRAMVLTGSNMSGKSSLARMIALLVIMAQIGCHLPCDAATIGIVDYVGTRFGASDEIARGRSTFMVELTETCEILKAATTRSLVVLDELGRGTSTNDGLAIAQAVLQYLITRIKPVCIFITHFPQLSEIAKRYPVECQMWQMAFVEEEGVDRIPDITFLYKLIPGLTDKVHGISIARMAGLPDTVCITAAAKSQHLEEADYLLKAKHAAREYGKLLRYIKNPQEMDTVAIWEICRRLTE